MDKLIIDNVDLEALEEQRLDTWNLYEKLTDDKPDQITCEEIEALCAILHMLDSWQDSRG
jgi:DNA-binding Xre family transcriptional regulator